MPRNNQEQQNEKRQQQAGAGVWQIQSCLVIDYLASGASVLLCRRVVLME